MTLPLERDASLALALAIVDSSAVPLLLLDHDLTVIGASASFWKTYGLDAALGNGRPLSQLGAGEWNAPRLRSLLTATADGHADIPAYEMDFESAGQAVRRLVLTARNLKYGDGQDVRLLLAISDVTDARAEQRQKEDLLRDKALLLRELQHRVANSLQIIASVIMQSARKVKSEETRTYLHDAHNRVMSVAALQQQLSLSEVDEVELRPYFTKLCQSLGASMIRDHDRLSLDVDVDDSACASDMSISLGLIVTELVINALKHAYPDDRPGKIVVSYQASGPNWTLSIQDDGVGMPNDPKDAKPGLGTGIVEALSRQLGATIEVEAADPGTKVSIVRAEIAAVVETSSTGLSAGDAV